MKWISRYYEKNFHQMLEEGKVLVIYGPRQVGKTSLITYMIKNESKLFMGDGMDVSVNEVLNSQRLSLIRDAFQGYDIVFIDEAHKVKNIGFSLKLLVDHEPGIKIIASGSSSFDLSNRIGEPLTGRQKVYYLFPVSILELLKHTGGMDVIGQLENLMIFGSYPEVITAGNKEKRIEYLINLRNSYLFKDILEIENIRNPAKLSEILRLLAFQIGNEVSLNEVSNNTGISKQTVERYLNLLEKIFIIKRVSGYSSNLRKEITKTHRYYFWDNGVRNALINNFNPLSLRNDRDMLWENLMFIERLKTQEYLRIFSNNYFWRTYDQKEVDMVEEREGKLFGYEFKWEAKRTKAPKLWTTTYPEAEFRVIDRNNFIDFLTKT